ncbi:hypothetical protein [Nostoc sp. KVJ3]|nr:hypothetical protein [Nostoc sp. KVJ3]
MLDVAAAIAFRADMADLVITFSESAVTSETAVTELAQPDK